MNFESLLRVCAMVMLGATASLSLVPTHAQDKGAAASGEPVPKTIRIEVDVETLKYEIVEPKGAHTCMLCSPALEREFGKGCAKAAENKEVHICQGLVNATVQDLNHITLLRSSKNPYCITVSSGTVGGTDIARQLCFCTAADKGACPAPAWYQ